MIFRNHRGDTIVEVVIAIAMFSIIAIGAQALMNQSLAATQGDFEINLVRNEIDSQANALRFMHNAYIASYASGGTPTDGAALEWSNVLNFVKSKGLTTPATFGLVGTNCPVATTSSFIINTKTSTLVSTASILTKSVTSAKVVYNADTLTSAEGIWIEGVRVVSADVNQARAAYVDFHIRACWSTVGQNLPHTLGTIVRLYDPI
jgi:hypothetical protein